MKKLFKLFILVITCLFVFSLTSCKKGTFEGTETYEVKEVLGLPSIVVAPIDKTDTFVGYYSFDEASKTGTLYLVGAVIPEGTYEPVYVADASGNYSLPAHGHQRDRYYFAGWYQSAEFKNGERVTTVNTVDSDKIVCAKYITLADAGIVAGVCIAIVFLMLVLLCLIVSAFKYLPKKGEKKETVAKPQPVVSAPQKAFTMEDIKDEDMMVAALVATIDYHNETKEDVRVVSVKQIG